MIQPSPISRDLARHERQERLREASESQRAPQLRAERPSAVLAIESVLGRLAPRLVRRSERPA
jgi:hypothetical protein